MSSRNSVPAARPALVAGAASLLLSASLAERVQIHALHELINGTEGRRKQCKPAIGEETPSAACDSICRDAAEVVPQPLYPLGYFGGLGEDERKEVDRSEDAYIEAIGGCTSHIKKDCFKVKKVDVKAGVLELGEVVGTQEGLFAFPMQAKPYFTCYSRGGKWPIFETWKIKADMQKEDQVAREGDFKVYNKKDAGPNFEMYHNILKEEYLRPADVKGYWSNFFSLDQGHWCPDAAFRSGDDIVSDTYFYINVSPQSSCLNRGNWVKLESGLRGKAMADRAADPEVAKAAAKDEKDSASGKSKKKSKSKAETHAEKVVTDGYDIDVIAGPIQSFPKEFMQKDIMKEWKDLLQYWSDSSEVLMSDKYAGEKYPHWFEVTWRDGNKPGHCVMRGELANPKRDELFPEYRNIPRCDLDKLVSKEMLPKISLFLMTEYGAKKTRRGVRVPMAYYKVATFSNNKWCCWMMDQNDNIFPSTDSQCLETVATNAFGSESSEDLKILPDSKKYAGDAVCQAIFEKKQDKNKDCDFHNQGVDWRGQYRIKEVEAKYEDLKKELEKVLSEKKCNDEKDGKTKDDRGTKGDKGGKDDDHGDAHEDDHEDHHEDDHEDDHKDDHEDDHDDDPDWKPSVAEMKHGNAAHSQAHPTLVLAATALAGLAAAGQ